jgi:hypothetical protein
VPGNGNIGWYDKPDTLRVDGFPLNGVEYNQIERSFQE